MFILIDRGRFWKPGCARDNHFLRAAIGVRDTSFPQYVFWEKIRSVLKKSSHFLGLRNSILRHRDPYFGDQNWSFFEKVAKKWNPTGTASFSEIVTCGDVWWNSSGSNEFYCKFPGLGYTQNSLLATKPNPNVLPVGTTFCKVPLRALASQGGSSYGAPRDGPVWTRPGESSY